MRFWKQTLVEGPDGSGLTDLERRAGQVTPWWDQRGVPDANPPDQPQGIVGESDLRAIDPNWEPR